MQELFSPSKLKKIKVSLARPGLEFEISNTVTDFSKVTIQWVEIKRLHLEQLVAFNDTTFVGIFYTKGLVQPYFQKTLNESIAQINSTTWRQILKYSNLQLHDLKN